MKGFGPFIAITKMLGLIIILFLLFYIFDTFVFEPFFDNTTIYNAIPSALYTLMKYIVIFGVPIGIFARSIQDAMED